jgi:hypothetical protein
MLLVEALNLGAPDSAELWGDDASVEQDDLVSYPWITDLAWSAARSSINEQLESSARGHWSFTFRAGRTPLDSAIAADVQATWAGALWLRRPIRQQLGAQLLSGQARGPRQWAYGVLMWMLAGGGNGTAIFEAAEPHLDADSANFIVNELSEAVDSPNRAGQSLELSLAAWDLLFDDAVEEILATRLTVDPSEHPNAVTARRLWAALTARRPEIGSERFLAFDEPTRRALFDSLTPFTLGRLSTAAAEAAIESARNAIASTPEDGHAYIAFAALSRRLNAVERSPHTFEQAPAPVVASLLEDYPEFVPATATTRAVEELASAVRRQSDDALTGRHGFGAIRPAVELGRVVGFADSSTSDAIETLLMSATDERLPTNLQFEARQGLALAFRRQVPPQAVAERLRRAADAGAASPFLGGVSQEVLKMSRLRVLAPALTSDELADAVAACREQDGRVREVALSVVGTTLEASPGQSVLESGLMSALFDPSGGIVRLGLSYVQRLPFKSLGARRTVESRLPGLFETGSRDVRLEVVRAARHLLRDAPGDRTLRSTLTKASDDRSWLVRFEAESAAS